MGLKKYRNALFFLLTFLLTFHLTAESKSILKENIVKAKAGDFIVTNQGKMFTVLHIRDRVPNGLILEEICAPKDRIPKNKYNWRQWVENHAPGNTSWVLYRLNTITGDIESSFSYTKNCWFKIRENENFLSTLLNMRFYLIPYKERKRVGPKGSNPAGKELRDLWVPKMVVDGKVLEHIAFEAWKARWPNDESELAGKMIEVYIPAMSGAYPSYFPYWLQISGTLGKAKIRIIESGSGLKSPKSMM